MQTSQHAQALSEETLAGLKTLPGFTFPRSCPHCGKVYESLSQFLSEALAIDDLDGLVEAVDTHRHRIIELLRTCLCGQPLVEEFADRRDLTPAGRQLRQRFSQLLRSLRIHGTDRAAAQATLLEFLKERGRDALISLAT